MFFERRERFSRGGENPVIRIINVNLQAIQFKTLLICTALIYITGPIQLAARGITQLSKPVMSIARLDDVCEIKSNRNDRYVRLYFRTKP